MFHAPISAPTASRMNTRAQAEAMPPTAASRTRAVGVAVLERDERGDDGARQQRDLQRAAGRVRPEQGDRQRDEDDQRDDRDERVEQRRRRGRRVDRPGGPGR